MPAPGLISKDRVIVHGCRFTVHSFSMNYATTEAFWMLISTLELISSHLNQKIYYPLVKYKSVLSVPQPITVQYP